MGLVIFGNGTLLKKSAGCLAYTFNSFSIEWYVSTNLCKFLYFFFIAFPEMLNQNLELGFMEDLSVICERNKTNPVKF